MAEEKYTAQPFTPAVAWEELKKDMDPALYSYICGLITHFALDSSCHPYILERMKRSGATHHEIESEFDGVVTEILVENEDNVEYGQPLFRIQTNK